VRAVLESSAAAHVARRRVASGLLGLALCALAPACGVKLRPAILDRKTQLENQILGTFQRLEDELILASSVRGERREAAVSPHHREALEAMMLREFQRDDLEALKAKQVVGEAVTGLVALLAPPREELELKRVQRLVDEENRCRRLIWQRAISLSPELSERDLPQVQHVFYRLNAQTARPGDRVQGEDGAWRVVQQSARPSGR